MSSIQNQVGIRDLRETIADRVARASQGERTIISVGGRLAAELGPIGNEPMVSLAGLLASGQVVAPARSDRPPPTLPLAVWAGIRMDSVLREVRGR